MPVLVIASSGDKRGGAHWWLSPWSSLSSFDPSSSLPLLTLLSMPASSHSPLLCAAAWPLGLAAGGGPSLSVHSALLSAAAARPAVSSAAASSAASSASSTLSSSPPIHPAPPPAGAAKAQAASTSHPARARQSNMFIAGLLSGLVVAGLFNPWDRALYLSVLHERPFLHRDNFANPYKGFFQALFLRTLSSGIYFPLFDLFQPVYVSLFDRYHSWRRPAPSGSSASPGAVQCSHPLSVHFLAGNTAGAVSGVVLNQLTAIKYASWDAEHGFLATARRMWREGGVRPFMKGIVPTVIRDTMFGGVFALTKEGCARAIRRIQSRARTVAREEKEAGRAAHPAQPPQPAPSPAASLVQSVSAFTVHNSKTVDFVSSLLAGALGTVVSSPFNFVRNIKYGWPASDTPPSAYRILSDLAAETKDKATQGGWKQGAGHMQDRLRIGWGTARVAVGMAVGYELYEMCKARLDKTNKATEQ